MISYCSTLGTIKPNLISIADSRVKFWPFAKHYLLSNSCAQQVLCDSLLWLSFERNSKDWTKHSRNELNTEILPFAAGDSDFSQIKLDPQSC